MWEDKRKSGIRRELGTVLEKGYNLKTIGLQKKNPNQN